MPLPALIRHISSMGVALVFAGQPAVQPAAETTIHVRATDYALNAPDSLSAGTHVWKFENVGTVRHEFILARLQPGIDVKAAVDSLHARGLRAFFDSTSSAIAAGALFAPPGQISGADVVTHDRRGDVLLAFCQLRDTPEKPKHDDLGMFRIVRIR